MMLEVRLSAHARYQMRTRKITRTMVVDCLNDPDAITRQTGNRLRVIKLRKIRSRPYLLVVIVDRFDGHDDVVTTFITSKIKKYL